MIKDQCDKCRKFGTDECGLQIVFDSNSCEQYSRRFNLEKQETPVSPESVNAPSAPESTGTSNNSEQEEHNESALTAEYLKENTEIGGWLTFFLFCICVGGIASVIISLVRFNPAEYMGSNLLALTDVALGVMLCGLSFYTLYAFIKRKPDAVYLGKLYVVTTFLTNLLVLFNGDYEASGFGSLPQIIRSLIWGVIWYAFLCVSTRVEEVIPKEYRKKTAKDYYITIALYLIPIVLLAAGVGSLKNIRQDQEAKFTQAAQLNANEYTDGKVIFRLPEGFSCERHDLEEPKLTIFSLEHADIGEVTLCSDYDTDMSQKNFNGYCTNWEDESAKQYTSNVECFEKRKINGRTYWYKVTSYEAESLVYWRFILLYDNASGKVCVISAYDAGYDTYIQELLESIRFQ